MDSEKIKYNKTKEKNYHYWQDSFDSHSGYMLADGYNEFAIIRSLVLSFVDDGDSILDVGCASGGTYDWIKNKKRNVIYKGTDYAENFVKANKKRHPNIIWEVEDCRKLNEGDNEFDVVVLYDVIDNMLGWELALKEASRVAIKRVILLMWMDNDMETKVKYMRDLGLNVLDIKMDGAVHFHRMLVGLK